VSPDGWPRVVWWSFYEGDASFDHFLVESLKYLSGGKLDATKMSAKDVVRALLQMLHAPGTLLVLDGFERVLRAFGGLDAAYQGDDPKPDTRNLTPDTSERDCISPLAELFLVNVALQPQLQSKVLLTTRLCPRVLEARGGGLLAGCREEPLEQMQPDDAVAFFQAKGIRGTHTEIERACEPYGYHPLSLCLLAGLIVRDFRQPGDVAAARRLDVAGDLVQRQHHVLQTAYDSLAPSPQALLGRIACFRSPVGYETLKALAESEDDISRRALAPGSESTDAFEPGASALRLILSNLDSDLHDLVARGLVHHDKKEGRFDLHPIARRYAYDRLAAPDRAAAHTTLRDYFAAVPAPEEVTRLEDLAPVIELYHHTVRAGQLDEAFTIYRDRLDPLYYQLGAYQLIIDLLRPLFSDGEDRPPRLKKDSDQAWTLNALANSYSLSGQPRRAVPLFEQHNAIYEQQGNKSNLAIGLGNVAYVAQLSIGALRAAEANLRRSIALCREIKEDYDEAIGYEELGRLLAYRGAYVESETELATALKMFERRNHVQGQGITWARRALCGLLRLRSAETAMNLKHRRTEVTENTAGVSTDVLCDLCASVFPNDGTPLDSARRALELADEWARTRYPAERDYVRAHCLLGAAPRVAGQPDEAERHLHEALERCRRINAVDTEADILIDLARLRAATGATDEAGRLADEALLIADRSGYVLQGADAHLELARLALARGDHPAAKEHAEQAHRLATCDGPPDHTYAAAYTESTALLAQLSKHESPASES
jgi:tetratricopeptide (TPR) repeat protein